jgi:tetratricopeptide (TPR) repeat protein
MSYPGNPSISPEVQNRIRATFGQTLELASRGSRQEASLGCDFILQLDPQFRPARTLLERLKTTDGAVQVDDLRDQLAGRPSEAERKAQADALFGDGGLDFSDELAELEHDLPDLAAPPGPDAEADADGDSGLEDAPELPDPPDLPDFPDLPDVPMEDEDVPRGGENDLRGELEALMSQRRFADAVALASSHADAVQADPSLAELASQAASRQEAAPYVERFLDSAHRARQRGDTAEAQALLDKVRSLDPTHPALAAGASPTPAASPAAGAGDDAPELPQTPSPAAQAPGTGTPSGGSPFDLGGGDDEGDRRIAELLQEGQAAFDKGDHQSAIDAWSRIFLIDIDHEEASRRIEEARRLKSEQERQVEEVYHDSLRSLEAGDEDAAREGLQRVLALVPGHVAAREQLERIESGATAAARPAAAPTPPPAPPASEEPDRPEPLKEEILVPPEPGAEPPPTTDDTPGRRTMVATRGGAPRPFLLIGSAVLVVVLVAGYLLWQNRDSIFPNADEAPAGQTTQVDPIVRATRLHEAGKTAMAINQLRRLPPSSPQYEEAQALISQWEAVDQPEETPAPETGEPPPGLDTGRQRELLAQARAAFDGGQNLLARSLLDQATEITELPPEGQDLEAQVAAALRPYGAVIELLEQGEQERALPELWRLHEEAPENPDLRRLIANAYYDLALGALQKGDAAEAAEHLQEAVRMLPNDAELARHLRFAQTYAQRDKDMLYRIYVKYLPPR